MGKIIFVFCLNCNRAFPKDFLSEGICSRCRTIPEPEPIPEPELEKTSFNQCSECHKPFPFGQMLMSVCSSCRNRKENELDIERLRTKAYERKHSIKTYCVVCFQPIYELHRGICKRCERIMNRTAELSKTRDQMVRHRMVTTQSELVDSAIKKNCIHSEFIDSSKIEEAKERTRRIHEIRGIVP